MKFRRKLLAVFALTVFLCVTAVAWLISYFARRNFEQASERRSAALVERFNREFIGIGSSVARRVESIASGETAVRMAISMNQGPPDYGAYLEDAKTLAQAQQLDFLEFIDQQGTILSSAQWPAKFGYKTTPPGSVSLFFQREDLPDGAVLGLCAMRKVDAGGKPLFVIGGQRIDRQFLVGLELPPGMRALLYENLGAGADPPHVIDPFGVAPEIGPLAALLEKIRSNPAEQSAVVRWTSGDEGDEVVHAIPLVGRDRELLGALLLTDPLRPYLELRRQIRTTSLFIGSGGILLAILLSGWMATRITRPVEQLAQAARQVAAGNWNTQVSVGSSDELAELAQSFNQMTGELLDQTERLIQAERVAAWRELARRLAHELKNPLFPLQLTVENLMRARQQSPEQFEEIFRESASTLLAEIANLKAIVSRFSEFSKMPQPQFQLVQMNEVVQESIRLFQPQLAGAGRLPIQCRLELAPGLESIAAAPELLHRALSNLILNAIDAMPTGGVLTLRTREQADRLYLEVSDTGTGLSAEECDHLFTPYYTTKAGGTGLGLAIVQSVVSDHGGRISVRSKPGEGTTFFIELPRNAEKLRTADVARSASGLS
jgi:two-component system, NtrC family, nitrogen regulation sensor histidine kinase NtrY